MGNIIFIFSLDIPALIYALTIMADAESKIIQTIFRKGNANTVQIMIKITS